MRIFFDMDGTLAKWHPEATLEDLMTEGYFLSLEPQTPIVHLAKQMSRSGNEVHILSCVINARAGYEKRQWLAQHCPEIPAQNIHLVADGSNKNLVPHTAEDVLVDDYSKNLHEWNGRAIKCLNGINGTHGTWTGRTISLTDDLSTMEKTLATC